MLPIRDDSTPINVRWFGADPTGAVDATADIQEALNYAATFSTGRAVYIPRGIYQITNSLIIGSNTRVYGDGIGQTVLRGKAGTYAGINVNGTLVQATLGAAAKNHVTVEHLTVDHQTNSTSANGIELVPDGNFAGTVCVDCEIKNCEVLVFKAHEYAIWSMRGQRIVIANNFVDGATTVFGADTGQEGIEIYGGYDVVVTGNVVRRIDSSGIAIGASSPVVLNSEVTGVTCDDNTVDACRYGIRCYTASTGGANPQNLTDVTINANVVRNCNIWGLALNLPFAGTSVKGVVFSNNVVSGCAEALHLQGFATAEDHRGIIACNNTLRDATSATVGAVYVQLLGNVVLDGNTIDNATFDGIRLESLRNTRCINNSIRGAGNEGIRVNSMTFSEIIGNRLDTITASGMNIEGTITSIAIEDNYLANWGAGNIGIYIGGTGSYGTIRNNQFFRGAASGSFDAAVDTGGTAWILTDNRLLYLAGTNPFTNLGPSPNFGTIAPGGGVTFIDVANITATNAVNINSHIIVSQIAGPALATFVTRTATGFRINFPAAAGTEQFQWEIRQ